MGLAAASLDALATLGHVAWYAAGGLACAATGMGLMGVDLARRHRGAGALLLAGLTYAALHVAVLTWTVRHDPYGLFDGVYLLATIEVAPILGLLGLLGLARRHGALMRPGVLGGALWVGAVTFAHLWFIAQAAASV